MVHGKQRFFFQCVRCETQGATGAHSQNRTAIHSLFPVGVARIYAVPQRANRVNLTEKTLVAAEVGVADKMAKK